jgi:hypothetical protein
MTRDTLQTILRAVGGLQEKSGTFRAAPEQRLTLYVGGDARGLAVSQVEEVRLEELFVVIRSKEAGQLFADYGAVFAVSTQPPKEGAAKKAGFA